MQRAEPGAYEEYLERVRAQSQRDRDRFVGADRHDAEPVYDARDGSLTRGLPPPFDVEEFMRLFNARFQPEWQRLRSSVEAVIEALRPWFDQLPVEDEEDKRPFVGILNSEKRPRHTYPRPRREWWIR